MPRGTPRSVARLSELAGAEPRMATTADFQAAGARITATHDQQKSSKRATRINLRHVIEVLEEEGLDPTAELVRLVQQPDLLDPDVRARFLNELMQYYQPKVKALEITGKNGGPIELTAVTPEQARRIAEEYLISQEANESS